MGKESIFSICSRLLATGAPPYGKSKYVRSEVCRGLPRYSLSDEEEASPVPGQVRVASNYNDSSPHIPVSFAL